MINRIFAEPNQDPHYPVDVLLTAYYLTSVDIEAMFFQRWWCYADDVSAGDFLMDLLTYRSYSTSLQFYSISRWCHYPSIGSPCFLSLFVLFLKTEVVLGRKTLSKKCKSQEARGRFKMFHSWSLIPAMIFPFTVVAVVSIWGVELLNFMCCSISKQLISNNIK